MVMVGLLEMAISGEIIVLSLMPCVSAPMSVMAVSGSVSLFSCMLIGYLSSALTGYLVFLVYLGGLLVMFGYVVALAPNPRFTYVPGSYAWWFGISVAVVGLARWKCNLWVKSEVVLGVGYLDSLSYGISYGWMVGLSYAGFGSYMFFCMICVTKLCSKHSGPLRCIVPKEGWES